MVGVHQIILALVLCSAGISPPATPTRVLLPQPVEQYGDLQSASDSQRTLDRARRSQERFEFVRRDHFPRGYAHSGECSERIGRFCLWHERRDTEIPEEPIEVREARERLLIDLERAAAALPEDPWIVGQLVRYLGEAGRADDAYAAAQRCRPEAGWWCLALTGYALHERREYKAAETAFADALAAMDPQQRCRWRDISPLITGSVASEYRGLACEERSAIEQRIWRLADPLYLYPGNDRLTEHFARWVQIHMQQDAATPLGMSWGRDLREIVLRYGWPTHYEMARGFGAGGIEDVTTVIHHHPDGRTFIPPAEVTERPTSVVAGAWSIQPPEPRSEYAPAYAAFDSVTEHQLALFRRGDSAIVLTAVDIDRQDDWGTDPVEVALFVAKGRTGTPADSAVTLSRAEKAVLYVTIADSALLSLELFSSESKRAGRARYGIRQRAKPRTVLDVSDILLLDEPDNLPSTLRIALPHARGSLRVGSGERIALYWELYGLQPQGEQLTMSLTMTKKGRSLLKTISDWIGITGEDQPLSLSWEETVSPQDFATPRSLAVELPHLDRGVYILQLQVEAFGREPVTVSRELAVTQ